LDPEKISRQMAVMEASGDKLILLSSSWSRFGFRLHHAQWNPTALWEDLTPVEWLTRKMGRNLHMANQSWLTSRELAEAAGPWDERLSLDDDGEYFCRVLLA